nr:tetratricopeptide repeat protein [bacterium]
MNRIFLHYLWLILVTYVFCNIAVPLWGFVSEGDGTRYTLETLDAATEDIERADDGSYLIHSSITIANRNKPDTLRIPPGTVLKFATGVELRIKGTLISSGKKNNPIRFTSQNGKKWNGIVFDSAQSKNAIIKYSRVENAQNGIFADSSKVKIMQNEIRQIASAAISFWNSSEGSIVGNTISESDIGVYCKESNPKIEDNKINNSNVGIFVKSGFPSTIKGNVISKSQNVAIILIDGSKSQIESNQLIENRRGISCNDSDPIIKRNSIIGGEYGIRLENDAYPIIAENTISDSSKSGIGIFQSSASIQNNTITRSRHGIYCEESSPRIEGNKIISSTRLGIIVGLLSNPIIRNNTITGKRYGIFCNDKTAYPILIDNVMQNAVDFYDGGALANTTDKMNGRIANPPLHRSDTLIESEFDAKRQAATSDSQTSESEIPLNRSMHTDSQQRSISTDVEHPKADVPDGVAVVPDYGTRKSGTSATLEKAREAIFEGIPKDSSESLRAPRSDTKSPPKRVPRKKIAQLENVIKNPKSTPNEQIAAQFELGRLHFKAGDYQQALASYDAIIEEFAGKKKRKGVKRALANVHYHRGLTYYQIGKYVEAIDACKLSMGLNPSPDVQLRTQYILAMSYMNMPDSPKRMAKQAFSNVLKFNPKDEEEKEIVASAYFQLGRIAMQREDYRDVIQRYPKALEYLQKIPKQENASKIVEAIAGVAYSYLQLKEYQKARDWYEQLVSAAQNDDNNSLATGHLALGDYHARDKKWAEAEQHYSAAIQYANAANWNDKLRGDIYFKWGESLLSSGKREPAQNAYQEALQLNPNARWQADASYNIGENSFAKKDYDNAIVTYKQAIAGYESALGKLEDEELIERAQTRIALSKFQLAESYANQHSETPDTDEEYQQILQAYQDARRASMSLSDEKLRYAIEKDSLYGESIFWQKLGRREKFIESVSELAEVAAIKNDATGVVQAGDLLFEAANNNPTTPLWKGDAGNYQKAAEVYEQALKIGRVRLPPNPDEERLRVTARLAFCYLKISENALGEDRDELLCQVVTNYDTVLSELDRIPAELVDNARYHKAIAHKLLGEYDAAAELFEAVISVQSDTATDFGKASLLLLAEIYEEEKKYDDAIRTYETAYKVLTEPHQVLALHKLGELSRQDGRYEYAIGYYQELVNQYPQSEFAMPAQYFIGLSYSSKPDAQWNDLNKACEAYETFIQKYSSSELALDAHWNLASLYDRLGQKARAMDMCQKIIETYKSPSDSDVQTVVDAAQNMFSNILLDKMDAGDVNVANAEMLETQLEQIIASPTQSAVAKANAHFELGNIHLRAKDYQSALIEYDGAISKSPVEHLPRSGIPQSGTDEVGEDELLSKIYYHKTLAHYELSEHADVITTCQEGLKLDPTPEIKSHLIYLTGVSYQSLDQQTEAEEAFKTVIQGNTDSAQAEDVKLTQDTDFESSGRAQSRPEITGQSHLRLGNLFSQQGRLSEAEEEYQRSAESDIPEIQAEAYHQMAQLYEQSDSENDEKIIDIYSNLLAVSNDDVLIAGALYKRGLLYVQQSQNKAAIADFEELIKRFSNSPDNGIQAMVEDANFRLSDMYGKQGDIDAAIEKTETTEKNAKQNGKPDALVQAQYQLASLYYKKAQTYEQTSKAYKQLTAQASRLYKSAYENANSVSDT